MMAINQDTFWRHVDRSGDCWVWTASRNRRGYGRMHSLRENGHREIVQSHRASWEMTYGPIPSGSYVLHHCDNPPCVRPDHLFIGSQFDNMRDAARKGRLTRRGEKNSRAKLTWGEVHAIRAAYGTGDWTNAELSRRYGVSNTMISKIVKGTAWRPEIMEKA